MRKFSVLFIFLLIQSYVWPQQTNPNDVIPLNNSIITGKLSNGLTYYIRENKKPEKRAFLRLVVNAGSVLENDNQQGLAHLVEHMAFNGSTHFQKNELVNYLESIGMRFGADVNAYTSFDETVYMLEVPTDTAGPLDKGFQIMEDWAHNLSFDPVEIDKERGVVIEEWRLGRGARTRIFDKQVPILLNNSRYAERLPIGKKDIIQNASYETLKNFYKEWYRPDLMAVVVVGDFDKLQIEKLIKEHFAGITNHQNEKQREIFHVPDLQGLSCTIVTDPEATSTSISFEHRLNVEPQEKVKNYRQGLVEGLFNQMFTERLTELSHKANPPFIYAYSSKGNFVRTKDFYTLGASVKDDGIETGFQTILTEAQRVKKFGFKETELARAKQNMLSSIEEAYKERTKTESDEFADELVRHFLTKEPAPGIAYEFDIYKQYLPGITLNEINKLAEEWIRKDNSVITVSGPDKKEIKALTEAELKDIFDKAQSTDVSPYNDIVSNLPLLEKTPVSSAVVNETYNKELNVTELKLANGVKIVLKPTDFKNDEIQFYSFCPGGTSLCDSASYIPAVTATSLVDQSGVGKFTIDQLQKMLAGKVVNVSPYIGELTEGLSGSSSVKDIETMFQLIYLYFTSPKIDSTSFISYKSKVQTWLMNRNASPESAFGDTLQVTLGNYNYRRMPWTESMLPQMDPVKSLSFYKDRFADASGFTFVFVGNFDPKVIKPLLETYLGGLPSLNKEDKWKDLKIFPPRGVISKQVYKGVEPKSTVNITFSGDYDWSTENNYELYSMVDVLRIKLREILREDKSGTYGVSISSSPMKYPEQKYSLTISFGCAPDRVDDLIKTTFTELDSIKNINVTDDYINKVKETQKREFEVSLKENNFWLSSLQLYYYYGNDLSLLMKYPDRVAGLNSGIVKKAAQKYFDNKNYIQVVLYPAK